MTVSEAKEIAREWVVEHAGAIRGFAGAFFHGSVNWADDADILAPTSDLDVMIVLGCSDPPHKPGKLVYRDVLLEVSYLTQDRVETAEQVLGNYHLAGSFRKPGIILDPTGHLTRLQAEVEKGYAKSSWVLRRCEHAKANALGFLNGLDEHCPFHDQVMPWLFGNGVLTHILLVAGLKNPTVRRRYLAARALLAEYGRLDFYETLLEMLGCQKMSRDQAEEHLCSVAEAFDEAKSVIKTPYRFAADLTDLARPIAIDGSRELIENGFHREAVFWMVATYSRCQWVLAHDAPRETQERFTVGYRRLLGDLGITSLDDLTKRSREVKAFLPHVWQVAEKIMAAKRDIESV